MLYAHQVRGIEFLRQRNGKAGLFAEMGPQPVDEPVLTPSGWRAIGDIAVGDCVIGSDGKATSVLATFDLGIREIVTVRFSDGASTRCTRNHLWTVNTTTRKFRNQPSVTKTLAELEAAGLHFENGNRRWYIPIVEPVEFEPEDLPWDPWLVGYLLGNG